MRWLLLIPIFSIWGIIPKLDIIEDDCKVCGEYNGGRPRHSASTLILKPNGRYIFNEWQHTKISIKDKGRSKAFPFYIFQ